MLEASVHTKSSLDIQAAGRAIDDDVSVKTGEPESSSTNDPFGGVSREFDPFSQVSILRAPKSFPGLSLVLRCVENWPCSSLHVD